MTNDQPKQGWNDDNCHRHPKGRTKMLATDDSIVGSHKECTGTGLREMRGASRKTASTVLQPLSTTSRLGDLNAWDESVLFIVTQISNGEPADFLEASSSREWC